MTKRLRRVQKAKKEAYVRMGTCYRCQRSIVWDATGLCRRCRPIVLNEEGEAARAALEAEKATKFFFYYITCRRKHVSDIGDLSRTLLAGYGPELRKQWNGLEEIAAGTDPDRVDLKVLERAWDESEAERKAAGR